MVTFKYLLMKHRILSLIAMLVAVGAQAQFMVEAGPNLNICGAGDTAAFLNVTLANGTAPFTYKWSPSYMLSDTTIANPMAKPWNATTYTVTVIDANNNTAMDSVRVFTYADAMQVTTDITSVSCNGGSDGSITPQVTGGRPPYLYLWTFTNLPEINISLSSNQLNAKAGWYSIQVRDANNCAAFVSDFNLAEPTAIALSYTKIDATCNGSGDGSITINANGGTPPYTYALNGGPQQVSATFNNLPSGSYALNVFDANNCQPDTSVIVQIGGASLSVSFNSIVLPTTCSSTDGSVCASVTGGSGPYVYAWSIGATSSCINSLQNGRYYINVTDILGCTGTGQVDVINTTSSMIVIDSVGGNNVSCNGYNDGSIQVTVTGNNPPFSYAWNTGNVTHVVTNLSAGTYTVTVTDALGCINVKSFNISAPMHLNVQPTITNTKCNGSADGSIDIAVTGGTAPYTYLWSTAASTQNISNLTAGVYIVTVSDAATCSITAVYTIAQPSAFNSIPVVTPATCGLFNGRIVMTSTGGTAPYSYNWSSGQATPVVTGGPGFPFFVTVTDANYCSVSMSVPISNVQSLNVSASVEYADCSGPGKACAITSGGSGPYTYTWQTGINTPCMLNANTGIYGLTVTDANGCSGNTTVTITNADTCVWPGDADYSGVADNNDLLIIGLAYGATGTTRADQSIDWYAHPSTNWATYLGDTTNYKHIDCNGDGVVDSDDTLAILQNYTLTHPRSGPDEVRGGIPSLRIRMVPDTLEDGETLIAHLELGDANSTATDIYGLAFTFNFDPLVVDSNEVYIAFDNNTWLCNNAADHIDISKKDAAAGKLHAALTRIDHNARSGGGNIGKVSMKITTGNINGLVLANYMMNCYISDLRVIDNHGNVLDVDAVGDTANIQYEVTGISEVAWLGAVNLYPNPAKEQLIVNSAQTPINSIQVQNLLGETVLMQRDMAATKATLNTAALAEGVYVLQLGSGNRVYHAKFVVVK